MADLTIKIRELQPAFPKLTELGFGGAVLGNLFNVISDADAESVVNIAWENGIRYFDTAPLYGYGLSEQRLGRALQKFPRSQYSLSTKVGRVLIPSTEKKRNDIYKQTPPVAAQFDYSYDGIMRSFAASLERIGTDYIDILYIHDIGRLTHGAAHEKHSSDLLQSGYRALNELRTQKAIRAVGIGVNEWEVCLELFPHLEVNCVMLAGCYTLLEQSALDYFFPACQQHGIAVIVAGIYNSGILAGGNYFNYTTPDADVIHRVTELRESCANYAIELPHAALQFPLLHSQVNSVVIGLQTREQVLFAIQAYKNKITPALWQTLKQNKLLHPQVPIETNLSNVC